MEVIIANARNTRMRSLLGNLLARADITINGDREWDFKVHREDVFARIIAEGSLGLGESYMDGWWECDQLDEFFHRVLKARLDKKIPVNLPSILIYLKSSLLNMQSRQRSGKVARQHYNLGNDFYMSFLDPYNQYTCGYFKDTQDLNIAQEQKLDLICRKLQLQASDRVLDIGCGWGGFARYAAEHYGCHVTGITISDEQIDYARTFCQNLPVNILKKDYRDLNDHYSKILICGMIEHVGYKNYRKIMEIVHRNLDDNGLFLLHTIGGNTSVKYAEPWTSKYIFPNSMIPSANQLSKAMEGLFIFEDWHNLGTHYTPTLKSWFANFHRNWDQFSNKYGEKFYRMWKYYLLSSAGAFKARELQLWQIVLSKRGVPGGYLSIR
ncbi:MAG: cyclopropane fatty acyl phospholipid synthase [Saprospiraceae bacterium]